MHKLSWNVGEGCVNERRLYAPRNSGGVILLGACRPPTRYLQAGTGIADTTGERPAQRTSSGRRGTCHRQVVSERLHLLMSSLAYSIRKVPLSTLYLLQWLSSSTGFEGRKYGCAFDRQQRLFQRCQAWLDFLPMLHGKASRKPPALSLRLKMQMRYLSARSRFALGI